MHQSDSSFGLLSNVNWNKDSLAFVAKGDSLNARKRRDKYSYDDFWGNIDTSRLESQIVFANTMMYYSQLPKNFFKMIHLKEVYLEDQVRIDSLPNDIGKLTDLNTLVITKSKIRYIPKSIGELKKLKILVIAWGGRLREVPPEIGELKELIELDLFRNKLKTLPPEIGKLKKLRKLILGENDFSEIEKERIAELLPHCEIQFEYNLVYKRKK
jgi:Leucine-rich repeat (LRR) protein